MVRFPTLSPSSGSAAAPSASASAKASFVQSMPRARGNSRGSIGGRKGCVRGRRRDEAGEGGRRVALQQRRAQRRHVAGFKFASAARPRPPRPGCSYSTLPPARPTAAFLEPRRPLHTFRDHESLPAHRCATHGWRARRGGLTARRATGDLSHLASIVILLLKMEKTRSCRGTHSPFRTERALTARTHPLLCRARSPPRDVAALFAHQASRSRRRRSTSACSSRGTSTSSRPGSLSTTSP
jgi:hypothetical protein